MSDRVKSLSTIHPDFDSLVSQLTDYLNSRPVWKDQLRSSTGQFTLEVASAVGELDQYSLERIMQDAFPETAKLDSAVYAAMKSLGTRLARKKPGSAVLPLAEVAVAGGPPVGLTRLRRTSNVGILVIPPMTQVTTSLGLMFNRKTIRFDVGDYFGYQVPDSSVGKEAIELFEGRIETRYFNMTGEDFSSVISGEDNFVISDSDVTVSLGAGGPVVGIVPRQTVGLWNNKGALPGWQDITTSDGRLHILFGSSVYATVPAANQLLIMSYAVTKGASGNGVFPTYKLSIPTAPTIDTSYDVFVPVPTALGPLNNSAVAIFGGVDQRPASQYKKLGSQIFAADQGNRAVQQQDYTAIVKDFTGVEDALVMPQRELDPSDLRFMNVAKIVTYPKNMNNATFTQLLSYVSARSMMSMNFYRDEVPGGDPLEPYIRLVDLKFNVYCAQNTDLVGVRDNYVTPAVLGLLDREWTLAVPRSATSSKLNRKITLSDFTTTIKNAHPSIDYVALLEPDKDVLAKVTAPLPRLTALNTGLGGFSVLSQFYSLTVVTPLGESLPSPPVNIVLNAVTNEVLIEFDLPSNYLNTWLTFNLYRGTTINNMQLVDPGAFSWTYTATTASFQDNSVVTMVNVPPTIDTTGEWVINLPNTWNPIDRVFMFNSERTPRLPGT